MYPKTPRAGEVALLVKTLATKPGQEFSPRNTHDGRREPTTVDFWLPHKCCGVDKI